MSIWESLGAAIGLMLVLEGLLPFTLPSAWKDAFRRIVQLRDGQIRFFGLLSISAGLVLLYLAGPF